MPFKLATPTSLTEDQALVEARKLYRRMLQRSSPGGLALKLALLQIHFKAMDRLEEELTQRLPRRLPPGDPRHVLYYIPEQLFHYWLGQDVAEAMSDFDRGRGTLELAAPLLEVLVAYRTNLFPKVMPEAMDTLAERLKSMLEAEQHRLWMVKLAEAIARRTGQHLELVQVVRLLQELEVWPPEYDQDELPTLAEQVASYLPFA